ncbi:hypothetical protein RUM43_014592 [Polyplax serrata]|uniref:N-acetyltransferase domain-containing protein n=1 Tax=Polyplax serrata TaxID=468196 RepID=A0AAN8PGT4_POLSC
MLACKYCMKDKPVEYLECNGCGDCVHIKCLKGCKIPGGLLGDVFFIYTCGDCNVNGTDYLERDKIAWVDVLLLTLYNLAQTCLDQSSYGYFHCNQHIKKFVNTHWKTLFPHMKTKRKSWKQMITSTLKSFCPDYFLCGDGICDFPTGLTGWYKLARPDMLPNHALLDRKGKRKKKKFELEKSKFNYFSEESVCCESSGQETDHSAPGLSAFNIFCSDSSSAHENMYSRSYVKPTASLSQYLFAEDDKMDDIDVEVTDSESAIDIRLKGSPSSSFGIQNIGPSSCEESKSEDDYIFQCKIKEEPQQQEYETSHDADYGACSEEENNVVSIAPASLFTRNENSNRRPWLKSSGAVASKCALMSESEEAYLHSSLVKKISEPSSVSVADIRLHRKLKVRKLRREKNLAVFDLNYRTQMSWQSLSPTYEYRVLDRYQHQTVVRSDENEKLGSFRTRLLGSTEQYTCFVSPFTQRVLKPFIRRDYESSPLWLKLLTELQTKVNNKSEKWIPPPKAPVDFSYVRPQHIPAINSLAQQYFWPGINLSECLQYPDFSCVVLYKKLIVGFAFLVPDVRINEAYISFIFTRPEWRGAGIGTFMLYHLIQTCMGRDITLHVSVTNPAFFLYQKFGFKVEEFIQDFYDRYLPVDSKDCKHAFFLRLSR